MTWASQVNTFLSGTQKVFSDVNSLRSSYNNLRAGISSATLGLVKLPQVSLSLNRALRAGDNVTNILNILGLTDSSVAGEAAHTVTSSSDVETGPFKWVEMETTPESFATADSVLLFAGDALYSNMEAGAELVPIGLCQSWQFSSGINVLNFKELRCEENIIIPGKSQPGSMSIGRLCGTYSSLTNRLHILPNWNYSTQSTTMKPLFGLMAMFLSPSREQTISTLYFERCAVTSVSMGINANSYQILDNVGIIYGRCVGIGELTATSSTTGRTSSAVQTTSTGTSDKTVTVGGTTVSADSIKNASSSLTSIGSGSTSTNTTVTIGGTTVNTSNISTSGGISGL